MLNPIRHTSQYANLARAALRQIPLGQKERTLTVPVLERVLKSAPLDQERLREFCRVTGYPDNGLVPITYPHVLAFPTHLLLLADPKCTLPLAGIIHVSMDIKQVRPIGARETLELTVATSNGRDTERGYEFDLLTTVRSEGEVVWSGSAGMLIKKVKAGSGKSKSSKGHSDQGAGIPAAKTLTANWTVMPVTIRRYAKVSRDFNPIHLSVPSARFFGLKRAIAHGMWTLTKMAGLADHLLTSPQLTLTAKFKLPLFLPGKVRAYVEPMPAGVRLRVLDQKTDGPHVVAELTRAETH